MQPIRAALFVAVLWSFAQLAHAGDAFEAQHQSALAANPPGVHLRISLDQGQTSFHVGETIRLQYQFTSEAADQYASGARAYDIGRRSTLERFVVDRPEDVIDPIGGFWEIYAALFCSNFQSGDLARKSLGPASIQHDAIEVTHYLRFQKPGTYRLYVMTSQVERLKPAQKATTQQIPRNGVDDSSLFSQPQARGGDPLASENTVSFEILPQDKTAAAREVEALAAKAAPKTFSLRPADVFRLFEIATPEARQLAATIYTPHIGDVNEIARATMISAPDHAEAVALLEARLRNPELPVDDGDLIRELAVLRVLQENPTLTADSIRHGGLENGNRLRKNMLDYELADIRRAVSTLDQRAPGLRAITIKTVHLMSGWQSCSLHLPLEEEEAKRLESLHLASMPDLPEHEQSNDVLNFGWACDMPKERVLPILRQIYEHPAENSSFTRETVLKEITKLDPDLARGLFRRQMLTGNIDISPYRISYLKLPPGPDLDADLIEMLEDRRTEDMERAAPIIGLYATASILPRVKKVYEVYGPDWPCHVEAGLLTYFLRVDAGYGQAKLGPALEASYRKADKTSGGEGSGCTEDTLLVDMALMRHTPEWEPLAISALNDSRPIVAAGGARVIAMGDVALTPGKPLVARLRELREQWNDFDIRKDDQAYMQRWRSGYNELESMILVQLSNANDSPEHLAAWKEAHDLCITDECRIRLKERIERARIENPAPAALADQNKKSAVALPGKSGLEKPASGKFAAGKSVLVTQAAARAGSAQGEKHTGEKIAEGEYCMGKEDSCDEREPWVLWREPDGNYLVEGHWARSAEPSSPYVTYRLSLSPDLFTLKYELEFGASGPTMICETGTKDLRCHGTDMDGKAISDKTQIPGVYEFMELPILWSFAVMARRASLVGEVTPVTGVIWQSEPAKPAFVVSEMKVRYLGPESISLSVGKNIPAKKYEMQWPSGAKAPLWITSKGLLLAMFAEGESERCRLIRYKEYSSFSPEIH